jgi:hypothetical protein
MLPVLVAAQGKHVRQRVAVGEKIRLLPHRAEQIQRHHVAGGNQARQQPLRLLDGRRAGSGRSASHAGFDKGGRGRGQLRLPGQVQAQGMLAEPALRIIESEDRVLLLAPVRRPCCLELLCYQENFLFPRVLGRRGFAPCPHRRIRSVQATDKTF